ncbi:hypothetical protein M153_2513000265 [Pseudoloma neurophilia]|uniref:Sugar phosphate transporter domain-containing protein n=1 Tax=Pseudoloma neurophilia TaxID=146866 RepID=A0A0R0LTR5_9MICR|nr:hypothetical protein M153_2513000265 [Pseudoloma neurophilia]
MIIGIGTFLLTYKKCSTYDMYSILTLISTAVSGIRWSFIQKYLKKEKSHLHFIRHVNLVIAIKLIIYALLFEVKNDIFGFRNIPETDIKSTETAQNIELTIKKPEDPVGIVREKENSLSNIDTNSTNSKVGQLTVQSSQNTNIIKNLLNISEHDSSISTQGTISNKNTIKQPEQMTNEKAATFDQKINTSATKSLHPTENSILRISKAFKNVLTENANKKERHASNPLLLKVKTDTHRCRITRHTPFWSNHRSSHNGLPWDTSESSISKHFLLNIPYQFLPDRHLFTQNRQFPDFKPKNHSMNLMDQNSTDHHDRISLTSNKISRLSNISSEKVSDLETPRDKSALDDDFVFVNFLNGVILYVIYLGMALFIIICNIFTFLYEKSVQLMFQTINFIPKIKYGICTLYSFILNSGSAILEYAKIVVIFLIHNFTLLVLKLSNITQMVQYQLKSLISALWTNLIVLIPFLLLVIALSSFTFLLILVEFAILKKYSSVFLSILGIFKELTIIILSTYLFKTITLTGINWVGLVVSLFGLVLYAIFKGSK